MPDRASKPLNWERIQQVFDQASQLAPERRQDWLAEACQGDRTLYLQVESLLLALDQEDGFLEDQIASYATRIATGGAPERIGAYRILSEIGRGGMGAVYLAERADGQYQRRVAIKLVQGGPASGPELLRRFRMERQILAGLQHPNIAQLLDAGVSDDGVPYLVMEYVEGIRIDKYCDSNALSLRARIELFRHVCSAVQYAHRNLVVHRDIKPSNILVTAEGVPKLLDFGIAKLLRENDASTGELEPTIALTAPAERLMTREYASPEQIRGLPITTATDVYALGIVLYGLLTGAHPFAHLRTDFIALERAVCETEPRSPSSAVSQLSDAGLAGELRGDLDSIVLKTIRKEPEERYVSVDQLSEDLNSYLNGFPVMARRGSRRYRALKFARRHRWGMAAATAFVLVLLAFGMGMSLLAARLARARTLSNTEAFKAREAQQTAEAVNHFLQDDLLAEASASHQAGEGPNAKADPDLTVRIALDRAAVTIEGKFARQPLVEANIRQTIGQAYANLGLLPECQRQWERSVGLFRRFAGDHNPDTLDAMRTLGDLYMREGKYTQAQQLYGETLELDRRVLGPQHEVTIGAMYSLGVLYTRQGKYPQAESLLAETLELSVRVSGEMKEDSVGLMRDLAAVYSEEGKYGQAEPLFQEALEVEHRLFGPEYNDILVTKLYLARLYEREGRYTEAEQLGVDALKSARRALGEAHTTTAFLTSLLANVDLDEGKYGEAQALFAKALDLDQRLFGEENPNTLTAFSDLARIDQQQGRYAEAERLYDRTLEVRRRVSGEEHPDTLRLMDNLAALFDRERKYAKEEALLVATSNAERRVLGDAHPETLKNLAALGRVQLEEGKFREAETTLRAALDIYQKNAFDTWQRYNCESLLGRALAAQNKFAEAAPLELSGYRGMVQREAFIAAPDRYLLDEAKTAASRVKSAAGARAGLE